MGTIIAIDVVPTPAPAEAACDFLCQLNQSEGLAAWAQFAGAMVALGLALSQGYGAARRERARDRAAAEAAYSLVANVDQTMVHWSTDLLPLTGPAKATLAERILANPRLHQLAGALDAFDTTRLPDTVFVTAVTQAQRALREFQQALEDIAHPPSLPLLIRDQHQPIENIQRARSIMVEPLLRLAPGYWRRRITQWLGTEIRRHWKPRPQ